MGSRFWKSGAKKRFHRTKGGSVRFIPPVDKDAQTKAFVAAALKAGKRVTFENPEDEARMRDDAEPV